MENGIIKIGAVGLVLIGLIFGVGINANASEELIINGGFESGSTNWNPYGDFYADSYFTKAHNGLGYAYVSNQDGTHGNNLTGWIYQNVTIPSNITSATLSFFYNITSQEISTDPHDILNVTIQSSTGKHLENVALFSNLHKVPGAGNPYYHKKTFDLTQYKGQTIRVNFLATTNRTLPTTFRIDDVSIIAQAQSPDLVVENIEVEPDPPIAAGYSTWKITIKNQSNTNILTPFALKCYFDNNYIGKATINGLSANTFNTSEWRAMTWPSDTNSHTIKGVVDSDYNVSESNENNNENSKSFSAAELPVGVGTLKIESVPNGAMVYIDETYKGVTPSFGYLTIDNLIAGDHNLRVTKTGYQDWTGTVTIPSGNTNFKAVILIEDTVSSPGNFSLFYENPVCDHNIYDAPAVRLNWTQSNRANSYHVYRNGSLYENVATDRTFYNSANVTAGQTYQYYIQARNASGNTNSNTISVYVRSDICGGSSQPTCSDGIENQDETDVDCGGNCPSCKYGQSCIVNSDCQGELCKNNICAFNISVSDEPDPFNPHKEETNTITISNEGNAPIRLLTFSMDGDYIKGESNNMNPGDSVVPEWKGKDKFGNIVSPGIYNYTITAYSEYYSGFQETETGTITVLGPTPPLEDTTPPQLLEFDFNPKTINTSQGPQSVTYTIRITDDISGTTGADLRFRGPSGQSAMSWGDDHLISGDVFDGVYQGTVEFVQYNEVGTWNIPGLTISDGVGNSKDFSTQDLIDLGFPVKLVNIAEIEDTTPPQLIDFNFDSKTIDTSQGPQTVTYTVRMTDDVEIWSADLWFKSPSGQNANSMGSSHLISGDAFDGIYQGTVEFPQYSEIGTWHVSFLSISDKIGNSKQFPKQDLIDLGFSVEAINVREIPPENQLPVLSFPETGIYASDGIDPNSGDVSTMFTFRIVYTDEDNDIPAFIRVCKEGAEIESCSEISDFPEGLDWTEGQELLEGMNWSIDKTGTYLYYFVTSDGTTTVRFPEIGGFPLEVVSEEQPLNCNIELRKKRTNEKIDKINIGETFDIVFTDYSGDIKEVKFLSDELQNGTVDSGFTWTDPPFLWTEDGKCWEWNWDATDKIMQWSFSTSGNKEVWAEVENENGQKKQCYANVNANKLPIGIIKHYPAFATKIFKLLPFLIYPPYYEVDKEMVFEALLNIDDENILYKWDFGDGKEAFGKNVRHSYSKRGIYTVTLFLNNGYAQTSATVELFVSVPSKDSITKLKERITLSTDKSINFLENDVLEGSTNAAKAADNFRVDVFADGADLLIRIVLNALPLRNIEEMPLLKRVWTEALRKTSKELSVAITKNLYGELDQLLLTNYSYYSNFVENENNTENVMNMISDKKTEIIATQKNLLDAIDDLELTQSSVESYNENLIARTTGNLFMSQYYTDKANLPNTFYEIKKEDENSSSLKWGKISWSIGTIAAIAACPSSSVIFKTNEIYESFNHLSIDEKMFLLSHYSLENSGFIQSQDFAQNIIKGVSTNTIEGLIKIKNRKDLKIAKGKIESVKKHGNNYQVVIKNISEDKAEYRLIVASDEIYTSFELFKGVGRYYSLPTTSLYPIDRNWKVVNPGETAIIEIEIPKKSSRLFLKLLGKNETGIYGLDSWNKIQEKSGWLKRASGWIEGVIGSPGELRIYDSQGNITGLVNEEIKEEIPNSIYDAESKTVVIFNLSNSDDYRYEVVGIEDPNEDTYGLEITSVENGEAETFNATDISTTSGQVHEFTVDWDKLSQGEKGVTMKIDADGDGEFETEIISDDELTQEEYLSNIPKQIKQSTIAKLESVKTGNKRINRKIDQAIKRIDKSLEDKLWINGFHLDPKYGKKVFREEDRAVSRLYREFKKEEEYNIATNLFSIFDEVIQDLIKSDKLLSEIVLLEAKNISVEDPKLQKKIDKKIEKAEKQIKKAEKELERGRMDRVIDRLGKAWKYIQKAMKKIVL